MFFMQIQQLNLYRSGELTNGNVPVEASLGQCYEDVLKQSDFIAEHLRIGEFNKYDLFEMNTFKKLLNSFFCQ
jgi:hypothetical protein